MVIAVTMPTLVYTVLETAMKKYGTHPEYFENEAELRSLVASIRAKRDANEYTTQEAISADVLALNAYTTYAAAPNLPTVAEVDTYSDAPGYMISSGYHLYLVNRDVNKFTSDHTLYLAKDIDLSTYSAFQGINGLSASFDGRGYTISNYTGTARGLLYMYNGASIKNLTLTDSSVTGGYGIAAVVEQYQANLTVENVTVRNTTVTKNTATNCIGVLVSRSNKGFAVTVRNCTVENCTIDITYWTTEQCNVGMIMGQVNADNCTFDHNSSINNQVLSRSKATSVGLYIGESTGKNVTVSNSFVYGGELRRLDCEENGISDGGTDAEGNMVYYYSSRGSVVGAFKTGSLTLNNILTVGTQRADQVIRISDRYGSLTCSNVFFDHGTLVNRANDGCTGTDTGVNNDNRRTTEQFNSGAVLYEANAKNGASDADWSLKNGVICFADPENAVPYKVTFTAVDQSDRGQDLSKTYYTDSVGKMIGDDVAATIAYADWNDPELALDKSFAEDADYTAKVNDIGVEFAGATLSLGGDIGVNYYVTLSEEVANSDTAYMQFEVNGATKTVYVKDAVQTDQGYKFTCDMSSIQMVDTITAQLIVNESTRSRTIEYSIRQYAKNILNNPSTTPESAALVKAMVNYGAYAQNRFTEDTDLANSFLNAADQALTELPPDALDTFAPTKPGSVTGLTFAGSTLVLDSCTAIRHYFKVTEGAIEDYTFKLGDTVLTPVQKGGQYYVEISDINATELGTMFTLTVTKGNESLAITYGAMSHVKNKLAKDTTTKAEENVLKALYWYYQAAVAYKQAKP